MSREDRDRVGGGLSLIWRLVVGNCIDSLWLETEAVLEVLKVKAGIKN